MIQSTDLADRLLSSSCATYVPETNAWLTQIAADFGVVAADIPNPLSWRAKRVGVLRLGYLTCMGESSMNQAAFNGQAQDSYAIKLKFYKDELADEMEKLCRADFLAPGADLVPPDKTGNVSPRIGRA